MTVNDRERVQLLLDALRQSFLAELPERCDLIEASLLTLEGAPDDRDTFNDLFRKVHSLKGSGGTHGLPIITTVCHQLETLITEQLGAAGAGRASISTALAHVDLLRDVHAMATSTEPSYAEVDRKLGELRRSNLKERKAVLVVESSPVMSRVLDAALSELPVQITIARSGLAALEHLMTRPFDFAVLGRELSDVNGVAVACALRESQRQNALMPVILVTTTPESVPAHAAIHRVVTRDKRLVQNLVDAVRDVMIAVG